MPAEGTSAPSTCTARQLWRPLTAAGRYLMAAGAVRSTADSFDLTVTGAPPQARLTVYIEGLGVGDVVMDVAGVGSTRISHPHSGSRQRLEVRFGRRLVLDGHLPEVALTDPFSAGVAR